MPHDRCALASFLLSLSYLSSHQECLTILFDSEGSALFLKTAGVYYPYNSLVTRHSFRGLLERHEANSRILG